MIVSHGTKTIFESEKEHVNRINTESQEKYNPDNVGDANGQREKSNSTPIYFLSTKCHTRKQRFLRKEEIENS
jgi:hypothetical protein